MKRNTVKTAFGLLFFIALFFIVFSYRNNITTFINVKIQKFMQKEIVIDAINPYAKDDSFEFVQLTDDFTPSTYQEILNVYYTTLNNGWEHFYFHCELDYEDCLTDIEKISQDQVLLTHINNYVHPYNSYNIIETSYDTYGNVYLNIKKNYTDSEISSINSEVNRIYKELIKDSMTIEQKIETIHNYILNISSYDDVRGTQLYSEHKSDTAYGPLLQGYAICVGYTDAMEIFLEKLEIKNYKIASDKHVWNFLQIDDKWYHLDLTWDDPITNTGEQIIDDTYFLITTDELMEINIGEHNKFIHLFDSNIYLEAK